MTRLRTVYLLCTVFSLACATPGTNHGSCPPEKSRNFEISRELDTKRVSAHEMSLEFQFLRSSDERSGIQMIAYLYSTGVEPTMLGPRFSIEIDGKISEFTLKGSVDRRKSPFYPEKQGDIIERARAPWENRASADISPVKYDLVNSKRIIFRFQMQREFAAIPLTDTEMRVIQCSLR